MSLALRDISVRRQGRTLLERISIRFGSGERVALIGANGAGKSTMLRVLAGVEPVASGHVECDGIDLATMDARSRSRRISLMLAENTAVFGFSALERVLLGRSPWLGAFGLPGDCDRELALGLLGRLEATTLAERSLTTLSSGERQRVAFAAALAQDAGWVLLDEPTSALDLRGASLVLAEIDRLAAEGRTVIAAMHDLNSVLGRFDRAVLIDGGTIVADGDVATVIASSAARRAWRDGFELVETGIGPVVLPRRGIPPSG